MCYFKSFSQFFLRTFNQDFSSTSEAEPDVGLRDGQKPKTLFLEDKLIINTVAAVNSAIMECFVKT